MMKEATENIAKIRFNPKAVYVIPLGGCGEFGLNMTLYLYDGKVHIVDCGLMFPDPRRLGIDSVILELSQWLPKLGKVAGYYITHGHEDHIGALPYIVPQFPAPVYATGWAAAAIAIKFARHGIESDHPVQIVETGEKVRSKQASIEWIHMNHSIPMTSSLYLTIGNRKVFHSGDFKLDPDNKFEAGFDKSRIKEIGKKGIDLFVSDSTNATKSGYSPSEASVVAPLRKLIKSSPSRVFVSLFSSNFWRIRTILELCKELSRPVGIFGHGIETSLSLAQGLGMFELPSLCMSPDEAAHRNAPDMVVLATGSQGESRAALARIIYDSERFVRLRKQDRIILSSRLIPGNERSVYAMLSRAEKNGAEIYTSANTPKIHVSGHAFRGEIEDLFDWLKPKNYLAVHGTFTQLKANQKIALDRGLSEKQAPLIEDGSVLEIKPKELVDHGCFEVSWTYADAQSLMTIDNSELRKRLKIGEQGLVSFFGVIKKTKSAWAKPPFWDIRGLPPSSAVGSLQKSLAKELLKTCLKAKRGDDVSETARLAVRKAFSELYGKKPVVIAHVEMLS